MAANGVVSIDRRERNQNLPKTYAFYIGKIPMRHESVQKVADTIAAIKMLAWQRTRSLKVKSLP